jgi:hypothetical protein
MKAIPVLKEPVEEDDDADYKPILSKYINTRCNYDGAKVDSWE